MISLKRSIFWTIKLQDTATEKSDALVSVYAQCFLSYFSISFFIIKINLIVTIPDEGQCIANNVRVGFCK